MGADSSQSPVPAAASIQWPSLVLGRGSGLYKEHIMGTGETAYTRQSELKYTRLIIRKNRG